MRRFWGFVSKPWHLLRRWICKKPFSDETTLALQTWGNTASRSFFLGFIGDDFVVCVWIVRRLSSEAFCFSRRCTSTAGECANFIMTDCLYRMLFLVTVILLLLGSRCRRACRPAVCFFTCNVNVHLFSRHQNLPFHLKAVFKTLVSASWRGWASDHRSALLTSPCKCWQR